MKKQPHCPECSKLMIIAELKAGPDIIYLDTHSGEKTSHLNAWVCPECRQVLLFADNPDNLGDPEDSNPSHPPSPRF